MPIKTNTAKIPQHRRYAVILLALCTKQRVTHPTLSHATIMCDVPRSVKAFVSRVLAHWTYPNTIWNNHATDFKGREQLRHRFAVCWTYGSSGSGLLSRSEEWHAFSGLVKDRLLAFLFLILSGSGRSRDFDAMVRMAQSFCEVCRHGVEASKL